MADPNSNPPKIPTNLNFPTAVSIQDAITNLTESACLLYSLGYHLAAAEMELIAEELQKLID